MVDRKSYFFQNTPKKDAATSPNCAQESCSKAGCFPAPKSRQPQPEYIYLCEDHIGPYNARWNYYSGMTPEEVTRENDSDLTWRRPRHLFGINLKKDQCFWRANPYEMFAQDGVIPLGQLLDPEVKKALAAFELDYPFTLIELKKQYRLLAKRHHPDTAPEKQERDDRFDRVVKNYQILLRYLKTHKSL